MKWEYLREEEFKVSGNEHHRSFPFVMCGKLVST